MTRFEEIENYLNLFKKIYSQNPSLEISIDTFYHKLSTFGLTKEEVIAGRKPDDEILYYFSKWKSDFKYHPNLEVYNSVHQKSFLQFSNSVRNDADCYKLYLNFSKDKMYESVKDIFTFIANNKIETFSKVADRVRSDSVVLRIPKKEDVVKVINYVNNNPMLTSSARSTNPFLPTEGVIGYAYDDNLSYNQTLSFMLSEYFKTKKYTNTLEMISLKDFTTFVQKFHYKLLHDKDFVVKFLDNNHISNEINRLSQYGFNKEDILTNFSNVIDFINISLHENIPTEYYFEKISNYMNKNYKNSLNQRFSEFLPKKDIINEDNYHFFKDACDATLEKYGEFQLITALKNGLKGNFKYFTNGGKRLRADLIHNVSKEEFDIYANGLLEELDENYSRN